MTKETRNMIIELRNQGMGYVAISHLVGESRDAVRYVCKSRGLGGFAQDEMVRQGKACPNCGSGITQTGRGRRRRFCSEDCRREWWRKHSGEGKRLEKAMYHGKCAHCGKKFVSYGNRTRKYCCHDCYIQERFWT